jgi:TRAP transporter TAXI family solute receptor
VSSSRFLARPSLFAVCVITATWSTLACQQPAPPAAPAVTLRLATTRPGTVYHRVAMAMVSPLESRGIRTQVMAGSAIGNVRSLQQHQADIALAAADWVYYSYVGELDATTPAFEQLRGIAVLPVTALVLVAGPRSGIHQFSDLEGHAVNIGRPETGLWRMSEMVLRASGIRSTTTTLSSSAAIEAVKAGTLDAMFIGVTLDGVGLEPFVGSGARLLPVTGRSIDQLLRDYPFWPRAVVRPPASNPITTLGGINVFVCSSELSADLVYNFTRSFFELLPSLAADDVGMRFMDSESAAATPVPLHEGAARYYREREMAR